MISQEEWNNFELGFFAGKFPHERYGQALLNHFHYKPEVANVRVDGILWEAKNRNAAIIRAQELGLLPKYE